MSYLGPNKEHTSTQTTFYGVAMSFKMLRKYCGRVFVSVSNPDSNSCILITCVIANVSVCHSYPMKFSCLSCCDANKERNCIAGEERMDLLLEA